MKIDFDLLDKMVAAGATGSVVIAFLREQYARGEVRRRADRTRKSAEPKRKRAETNGIDAESKRDAATLSDTPRARLFREGKGALLTLGLKPDRAGALIAEWLKLTNNDEQLITATILQAQNLNVAEAPGYIRAILKGKMNGNGTHASNSRSSTNDFFSGLSSVAADLVGDGAASGTAREEIPRGRVEIDG